MTPDKSLVNTIIEDVLGVLRSPDTNRENFLTAFEQETDELNTFLRSRIDNAISSLTDRNTVNIEEVRDLVVGQLTLRLKDVLRSVAR